APVRAPTADSSVTCCRGGSSVLHRAPHLRPQKARRQRATVPPMGGCRGGSEALSNRCVGERRTRKGSSVRRRPAGNLPRAHAPRAQPSLVLALRSPLFRRADQRAQRRTASAAIAPKVLSGKWPMEECQG